MLNNLISTGNPKEYLISEKPVDNMVIPFELKTNLLAGTYKFIYRLYDAENYIGEVCEYIIIK